MWAIIIYYEAPRNTWGKNPESGSQCLSSWSLYGVSANGQLVSRIQTEVFLGALPKADWDVMQANFFHRVPAMVKSRLNSVIPSVALKSLWFPPLNSTSYETKMLLLHSQTGSELEQLLTTHWLRHYLLGTGNLNNNKKLLHEALQKFR